MNRRSFLKIGLAAPAVILTPGLLMPIKSLWGRQALIQDAFAYLDKSRLLSIEPTMVWIPHYNYGVEIKYWLAEIEGLNA